jgi:pyruvate,water dikinase
MESGAELWKLSREALAVPEVARLIMETPVKRIVPLLGTTDAGRAFKQKLDAFFETYGWRTGAFEHAEPAWIEDPSVPLITLRDFMRSPEDADPAGKEAHAAEERDELLARVSTEIDAAPDGPMLRLVLGLAQQYLPIQENHNFYIDQMNTVLMRRPALEAGRRLAAADALALADDVFLLTVDEVKQALQSPSARNWAELAAERRDLLERQRTADVPSHIGTPPAEELLANPAVNSFSRFFGEAVEQDESSNVLVGTAASRGTVTGRACVMRTLDEADRLQIGDILVCEMTMPAWTPLFAVASAVVTDSGGALSHSAIVAREYGIPCVVGTTSGTRRIVDGQRITVDGTNGTVIIEPD